MKKWTLATLASLMMSTSTMAQEPLTTGLFGGASVGVGQHTLGASGYNDESGNASVLGLHAGYQINDNVSVLIDYSNYGEADLFDIYLFDTQATIASETTGVSVIGQLMTDRNVGYFSFGARLGLISWQTDLNLKANGHSETLIDDSGIAAIGGLVGSYAMTEKLDLVLSMDWFVYDHKASLVEDEKIDFQHSVLKVGVNYYF